ncbi:hypothetical protein KQX54_021420 [Cotesia glomerata]|uniref:Uncharacterized protein n=1 Tax=Cotesia glomerata TaxID=32391 RepID=A0AAV7J6T2_COTGL|nr:hypothetical protein KQX54_021420 [Cotesia glomerata]
MKTVTTRWPGQDACVRSHVNVLKSGFFVDGSDTGTILRTRTKSRDFSGIYKLEFNGTEPRCATAVTQDRLP